MLKLENIVIWSLIVLYLFFRLHRFYIEKKKAKQIQIVDHKKEIKRVKRRASFVDDRAKRNSLMPGNSKHVRVEKVKELKDIKNFEHKFFGTVLEVDHRVLIRGLTKKMHTFEIIDGVSYVDGQVVQIHPDEVLRLVRSLQ